MVPKNIIMHQHSRTVVGSLCVEVKGREAGREACIVVLHVLKPGDLSIVLIHLVRAHADLVADAGMLVIVILLVECLATVDFVIFESVISH